MSAVAETVSRAAERLRPRPRERTDDYAFCAEDNYWFRPAYTAGKCPLCGAVAPGGAPPAPLLVRMDRSWFGVGAFVLLSVGMSILVLVMYFSG